MSSLRTGMGTVRRSFTQPSDIVPVPNLIEIQSRSFNEFVQLDYLPEERRRVGLEKVFQDIFPVEHNDKLSLEYVSYEVGHWSCTCGKLTGMQTRYTWSCSSCHATGVDRLDEHHTCPSCSTPGAASYISCPSCFSRVEIQLPMTVSECRSSGQTFALPLKVTAQLITWDRNKSGERVVRDVKEQEIYFADIPVMADLSESNDQFSLGSLGTFIINGVDRVIVSQLHRSPGAVFSQSKRVKDMQSKPYYFARLIPMRGSWLDFEFDSNDYLYVRIDKKKKIFVTTFLQALGLPREEIIPYFYGFETVVAQSNAFYQPITSEIVGKRIEPGMLSEETEEEFRGKRITKATIDRLKKRGIEYVALRKSHLLNRVFGEDVVDPDTGEILAEQGQVLTQEHYDRFKKHDNLSFKLITAAGHVLQPTIPSTLAQDKCKTQEEALKEIHAKVWPGDTSSSIQEIQQNLEEMFFNSRLYDLTRVGRIRINRKLGLDTPEDTTTLTREDIFGTIRYLVNLRERGEGELDDIDHLGNRRVRLVGELLTNQVYVGLLRIERVIRERFRIQEMHGSMMPQDFLNVKPLSAVLKEFFGTGQLSQFMDQTNPLSEIAHKRRLSALGPGGVTKDRATFEVRDVHTSHYGRICPIETPEGQTIGLISSLATYAVVNELGFIETAYRPIRDNQVQDEVAFLDAFEEASNYIGQAEAVDRDTGTLKDDVVFARHEGNFLYADATKINYVDLSPKQLVSVSTALIPFLEHDDASRALMGANMQRQAVPLVKTEAPIVGTGMEHEVIQASGVCITAKRSGTVEFVSSQKIVVRADEDEFYNVDSWLSQGVDMYHLRKFEGSSHRTWLHQTPVVKPGDRVQHGDLLTDSSAVDQGELALGANLIVAFMPWHGYNFEDAIVLNKRLVAEDVFTSVHIDEYTVDARDTKLGPEELTRDIPNVSEGALSALDQDGIVSIGTRVKPGDILVGKVTLKGDVQFSPEEKLLRAIFGEKSREVRDTSLRVPPGVEGTVVDVKVFSRSGVRRDTRYKKIVAQETERLNEEHRMHCNTLKKMAADKVRSLLGGKAPKTKKHAELARDNVYAEDLLHQAPIDTVLSLQAKDSATNSSIERVTSMLHHQMRVLDGLREERIAKLKKGDPLPSGVIKTVKVYIAMKRPIQVGDKLSGRHGNKGVISTLVPREDMPFLEDGTPVDIVLNPLGVAARMNIGQILETLLGHAGHELGNKIGQSLHNAGYQQARSWLEYAFGKEFIDQYEQDYGQDGIYHLAQEASRRGVFYRTPVFESGTYDENIKPILKDVGLSESGAYNLRDGGTGEYFDQSVTVGIIYMMKLNHMADDKLHARCVGPYSLVTQQPLGGKAQMGGQRLGEMEVWALEAYGASYALQEMLTYKSDDVNGRHKVYEAIVRGDEVPEPGLPESFNVLIKELQSLALRIDLFKSGKEDIGE